MWPATRSVRKLRLGLDGDGARRILRRRRGQRRDADLKAIPRVASTGEEMHRSGGGEDGVFRSAPKTKTKAMAMRDDLSTGG